MTLKKSCYPLVRTDNRLCQYAMSENPTLHFGFPSLNPPATLQTPQTLFGCIIKGRARNGKTYHCSWEVTQRNDKTLTVKKLTMLSNIATPILQLALSVCHVFPSKGRRGNISTEPICPIRGHHAVTRSCYSVRGIQRPSAMITYFSLHLITPHQQ